MAQGRVGLPIIVEPKPGESFSSWLARFAGKYGETPQGMILDAAGKALHIRHPDEPSAEIVAALSERTGIDASVIEGTTVRGRNLKLGLKAKPDIVDTVFAGRAFSWCPECLAEDGYWQLWWTSPAVTVCAKHSQSLIRNCPSCKAVPRIKGPWPDPCDVTACAMCGSNLSNAPDNDTSPPPGTIHWSQIMTSANGESVALPNGEMLSVREFLQAVVAMQAVLHPQHYAREDYEKWACWQLDDRDKLNQAVRKIAGIEGELITPHSMGNAPLFQLLGWLFSDWPENFETLWLNFDKARRRMIWDRRTLLAPYLRQALQHKSPTWVKPL